MKQKRKLTEEEIDRLVIAEANDTSKWEKPIAVKPTSIRFSPSIIEKAKYFAKLQQDSRLSDMAETDHRRTY